MHRRTILKIQLNTRQPPKRHQRKLDQAIRAIIYAAEETLTFGDKTALTVAYHNYLDALSAWGRIVVETTDD